MNSLEFINEKIEIRKVDKEAALKIIKEYEGIVPVKAYKKSVEHDDKEILALQQIKDILEAWEVVKNKCVDMHDIINCSNLEVYNTSLYKEYQLTEKEYQIIKKALEVNNNE